MPVYVVDVNGYQTIIEAETREAARREGIDSFVVSSVRLATEKDIAWQEAMTGPVTKKETK